MSPRDDRAHGTHPLSSISPTHGSGVIARYRDHLPVSLSTPVITLGEGDTPLIRSERLSSECRADVWLKCEGLNPTGSFKDRGMTVAVSRAAEEGAAAVICASTGNTSASAAAYAARGGLSCAVVVPRGNVATGKLAQALAHGARVLEIDGTFDDALRLVREVGQRDDVALVNSVNPFRIEGQKTAAFEIVDVLGKAPDLHIMPVGNAGNITAYWKGYREIVDAGSRPRMFGFQAAGAAPIVTGTIVERPDTIAGAIRIGRPASWDGAVRAASESGGAIQAVADEEIATAYDLLAREGVFVEPPAAVSVAGLLSLTGSGGLAPGKVVVCVLTGHGLKDPGWALESAPAPVSNESDARAVERELRLSDSGRV